MRFDRENGAARNATVSRKLIFMYTVMLTPYTVMLRAIKRSGIPQNRNWILEKKC